MLCVQAGVLLPASRRDGGGGGGGGRRRAEFGAGRAETAHPHPHERPGRGMYLLGSAFYITHPTVTIHSHGPH